MKSPWFLVIYLLVVNFRMVLSVISTSDIMCDCQKEIKGGFVFLNDSILKIKCKNALDLDTSTALLESTKTKTSHSESTLTGCVLGSGEVIVPVYVFYVIGILMLLITLIIIYLVILVNGSKLREFKFSFVSKSENNKPNINDTRTYTTQTSQEMTMLNVPPSSDTCQEPIFNENCRKNPMVNVENELNGDDTNVTNSQQSLKIYKSVRKPNHQLLLREQMKKICEDALAKSHNNGLAASLRDLNNLFAGVEQRNLSPKESAREKSASNPLLDIYDEPPPKNIPVDQVQPLYDCLPTSKNIIIEDYDTKYLLALSKDDMENGDYINAQYRFK